MDDGLKELEVGYTDTDNRIIDRVNSYTIEMLKRLRFANLGLIVKAADIILSPIVILILLATSSNIFNMTIIYCLITVIIAIAIFYAAGHVINSAVGRVKNIHVVAEIKEIVSDIVRNQELFELLIEQTSEIDGQLTLTTQSGGFAVLPLIGGTDKYLRFDINSNKYEAVE